MFPFRLGSIFRRSQAPERSAAGAWGAVILMVTIAVWCFFQFCYPYHFFFQEQNQLFLWSSDYLSTYFEKPGGLALLVGDFLTQFYYYLFAGSTILSLVLFLASTLLYISLRNFKVSRPVALLLALAVMLFLAVCHFSTSYRLCHFLLWPASYLAAFRRAKNQAHPETRFHTGERFRHRLRVLLRQSRQSHPGSGERHRMDGSDALLLQPCASAKRRTARPSDEVHAKRPGHIL